MNHNFKIKIIIKHIFLLFLAVVGYLSMAGFWLTGRKNKLIILRYHSVSYYRKHEVNVSPGVFRKQMEFLAGCYNPVPLSSALKTLRENRQLDKKTVIITFDDGYKDNFTHAYPILKELQIPATIFLSVGYIGSNKILPHDISDEPRHNYLLNWDEVRAMSRNGIEFGSHTINHANLGQKDADIKSEIEESRRMIEQELGKEVRSISYPFGLLNDFDEEVKRIAKDSGYSCGCSAMNGVNDSKSDIFELKRIGIEASDSMFTFRAKLNGALDLLILKDTPVFNRLLKLVNKIIGV